MICREFKSKHVGFIDDVLSARDMAEMRRHLTTCPRCANLDVRIRRSLMVVRNLPQIEPSADFYARLTEALKQAPPPDKSKQPFTLASTFFAVTAAIAAAVYFAMAFGVDRARPAEISTVETAALSAPALPAPINDVALAAAVPAGVPVWPAMFMVGELPMHVASADLLENGFSR